MNDCPVQFFPPETSLKTKRYRHTHEKIRTKGWNSEILTKKKDDNNNNTDNATKENILITKNKTEFLREIPVLAILKMLIQASHIYNENYIYSVSCRLEFHRVYDWSNVNTCHLQTAFMFILCVAFFTLYHI